MPTGMLCLGADWWFDICGRDEVDRKASGARLLSSPLALYRSKLESLELLDWYCRPGVEGRLRRPRDSKMYI